MSKTDRDQAPDPHADRPVLSVVIVNYRSWADVSRLVVSLANTTEVQNGQCELIVVDNASGEPVPTELAVPRPDLTLILREDNGGFAVGVNAGWHAARGRWLLVLNPDIETDADLLAQVLDRIAVHERAPEGPPGVVGFALCNADGTRQPSVGQSPSLLRSLRGQFLPRARRKYQPAWRVRPGPVPWVTGACVLVDARLLAELDGMDEDFFLYYEEVALCRSAWQRGRRVEFDPAVSVKHLRPLQNRSVSPTMRVITRHSKLLYFRKHLPRWQFLALCGIVSSESWFRERLARWSGRGEDERAWRLVRRLVPALRGEIKLRGTAVRELAETVISPARPSPAAGSRRGGISRPVAG